MLIDTLAEYCDISADEVERLLSLSPAAIYDDEIYRDLVAQLDEPTLRTTLLHARDAYDQHLDPIKAKYGLSDTIMSGHTLCNWVLGFLMYPDRMRDMLDRHSAVPTETIVSALPELIAILDRMPDGRVEWQRALVTFSLPLVAGYDN